MQTHDSQPPVTSSIVNYALQAVWYFCALYFGITVICWMSIAELPPSVPLFPFAQPGTRPERVLVFMCMGVGLPGHHNVSCYMTQYSRIYLLYIRYTFRYSSTMMCQIETMA